MLFYFIKILKRIIVVFNYVLILKIWNRLTFPFLLFYILRYRNMDLVFFFFLLTFSIIKNKSFIIIPNLYIIY